MNLRSFNGVETVEGCNPTTAHLQAIGGFWPNAPQSVQETNTLQALGDEARLLTLQKAHAALVLRWRGRRIPPPEALQQPV